MSIQPNNVSISQPRYLPAINYLQRIYHSDIFIVLDDCQHQRRAFEHRNRIIKCQGGSQRKSQWLTLNIDRSLGSRPLIKDIKLNSLIQDLYKHFSIIKNVYGKDSIALEAFQRTCISVAEQSEPDSSFVDFCILQILEIYSFLGIALDTRFLKATEIAGGGTNGSIRLLECCIETKATSYISGPNGREYLSVSEFEQNNINVIYHDFIYPQYSQVGRGSFVPWMAWIDMLHSLEIKDVASFIHSPLNSSFT